MKTHFFIILSAFFLVACKKKAEKQLVEQEIKISKNVSYLETDKEIQLHSTTFDYQIDKSDLPYQKIILLNASLLGYISALNAENRVIGVTSPQYIYSDIIHQGIEKGSIQDVGNDQKYDIEKIISLEPDVIFTNYIASFENTYDILKKSGIEIIFLNEYIEQQPLEKAKYIKVFGQLLGKKEKADSLYQVIEHNYAELKEKATHAVEKPIVLTNEMYGNQWYMPGGKTQLAYYLQDANAHYILKENTETRSIPMSFEEVYAKSTKANYWVNVGNHATKKELTDIQPNYAKLNAFENGEIFTINGRVKGSANDYFESGSVRVDWVLKDYITILHPDVLTNKKLIYMKELK